VDCVRRGVLSVVALDKGNQHRVLRRGKEERNGRVFGCGFLAVKNDDCFAKTGSGQIEGFSKDRKAFFCHTISPHCFETKKTASEKHMTRQS